MRIFRGLIPATAAVTAAAAGGTTRRVIIRAAHNLSSSTYHHSAISRPFYRSRPQPFRRYPAFGWASRGRESGANGGRDSGGSGTAAASTTSSVSPGALQELATAPESLLSAVVAVASDVDGTLTRKDSTVSERTKDAIKAVLDSDLLFFPATGKTRAGMYEILGEEISSKLKAKNAPGVFIQGLVVYSGASDEVLFERLLCADVIAQVESFCEERGVSLIAYCGDRIVCSKNDEQTDKIRHYLEPMPEAVGRLTDAVANGLRIHKLILMDTIEAIDRVRPVVKELVGEAATLTQALPDMLEVLPPGASKGNGVELLLAHLDIESPGLMALGDAENDVDMLRHAGVGVCVGNASPPAKSAAKFIAPTNADDGAAVAMELLLRAREKC